MLLNITSRCNENCKHCLVSATPDGVDSTIEDIQILATYITVAKPMFVVISGGEITLSRDWYEKCKILIDAANSYNGTVILESNGSWFWDGRYDEVAPKMKLLLDEKCVSNIQFSSNKLYYPNYQKYLENEQKIRKFHSKVNSVINWQGSETNLIRLGRAKELIPLDETTGKPGCLPVISRLAQFNETSFSKGPLKLQYTKFNIFLAFISYFCKPMVQAATGSVFFGESVYCLPVDNIKRYPIEDINKYEQMLDEWFTSYANHKKPLHICNGCNTCKNIDNSIKEQIAKFNVKFWPFKEDTTSKNFTNSINGKYISDNTID